MDNNNNNFVKVATPINTRMIARCGVFVALMAITSQIAIPIGPVPINLAVLTVLLAGSMLGAYWGVLSVLSYILLGAIGLPIFSKFGSGLGALVGPTGGFLLGYIVMVFLTGLGTYSVTSVGKVGFDGIVVDGTVSDKVQGKTFGKVVFLGLAMVISLAILYAMGTLMFVYSTNMSLNSSLWLTVLPFIPGDLIKIALALVLTVKIKRIRSIN
jgi:biotin transport system substrate-specific component